MSFASNSGDLAAAKSMSTHKTVGCARVIEFNKQRTLSTSSRTFEGLSRRGTVSAVDESALKSSCSAPDLYTVSLRMYESMNGLADGGYLDI